MYAAGRQQGQLDIVASGQRQLRVSARIDHRPKLARFRLEYRRRRCYLHGLIDIAYTELEIEFNGLIQLQNDVRLHGALKSRTLHPHLIASDRQAREVVESVTIRRGGPNRAAI